MAVTTFSGKPALKNESIYNAMVQAQNDIRLSKFVMNTIYEVIIYWSEEDSIFVAEVPELPGCMAHGKTHEEALQQAKEAIDLWIDTAKDSVIRFPSPKDVD